MQFISFVKAFISAIPAAYWKYIALVILCFALGMKVQSCIHHCPKCPEGRGSSVSVRIDTVYRDTSKGTLPAAATTVQPRITFRKILQPVIQPTILDTPKQQLLVADTSYCYQTSWKETDGAAIGIKVCSAILPQLKPPDWTLEKWYVAAPKIEKTISIRDTLPVEVKQPIFNKWWFWLPITIGAGVAGYYAHK